MQYEFISVDEYGEPSLHTFSTFTDYVYGLLSNAAFDELKKVPSIMLPAHNHGKWTNIHMWCKCEVGEDNYTWTGTRFYFSSEQAAVLFALRWL